MKKLSWVLGSFIFISGFQAAHADEFMPGTIWANNNGSDKDDDLICKLRAAGSKSLRAWMGVESGTASIQNSLKHLATVFCLFKSGNPNSQVTMVIHPGEGDHFAQPTYSSAKSVFSLIKNYPVSCGSIKTMGNLVDVFEIGNEVAQAAYWGKKPVANTADAKTRIANYVDTFLEPANAVFGASKISTYGANWAGSSGYSFSITDQIDYLASQGAMSLVSWVGMHIYATNHADAITYERHKYGKKVIVTEWSAKSNAGANMSVFQKMLDNGALVVHYFTPVVVMSKGKPSSASVGALYDDSGSFNPRSGGWAAEFAKENLKEAGIKPSPCGSGGGVTVPTPDPAKESSSVKLSGSVVDANGKGLSGLKVYLDKDNPHVADSNEVNVKTDASGNFVLTVDAALADTNHRVRVVVPSGYTQLTPTQNYGYDPSRTRSGEKFVLKK